MNSTVEPGICQQLVSIRKLRNSVLWLGMEGSNLRFLIQSQASYHWTNPQRSGAAARDPMPATSVRPRGLPEAYNPRKVQSILLSVKLTVK